MSVNVLEIVSDLSRALATSKDSRANIQGVVDCLKDKLEVRACFVILEDHDNGRPTITTASGLSISEYRKLDAQALEEKLMLDKWVYEPGLPANVARPDPAAFANVDKSVAAYAEGGPAPAEFSGWTTAEKLRFLNRLPRKLPAARLNELNGKLGLNEAGNNEVLFAWLDLAIANRYQPAVPVLEQFLTIQGRRKFVKPLITALAKDADWGRPIAARIYAKGGLPTALWARTRGAKDRRPFPCLPAGASAARPEKGYGGKRG
jgi:hypothetical protein